MSFASFSPETLIVLPLTILAFLVLLTIIVFIHEYGHFSVARALGVKVDVFSIGFGKTLAKWVDRKGTEWRIAMLPLGGYVKFFGDLNAASQAPPDAQPGAPSGDTRKDEDGADPSPATTQFPKPGQEEELASHMTAEERAVCFHFKPVWARAAIVAAGPIFNFILAIVIFAALFMTLGRAESSPVVGSLLEGSAAEMAGLEPGDEIISVQGRKITKFRQLQDAVLISGGEPIPMGILRDGEPVEIVVTPARIEGTDRYGNPIESWQLGIQGDVSSYSFEKLGPIEATKAGVHELWRVLSMSVRFLGRIIMGQEDASQLGGPIKMAQYAGQSAMSGFDGEAYSEKPSLWTMMKVSLVDFISLAAVVSVSIGFLNLLPVPVLDGGHLVYYAYESVAGKPLGPRAQAIGFRVGLVMLASLMIFVTWNDINNLISSIS